MGRLVRLKAMRAMRGEPLEKAPVLIGSKIILPSIIVMGIVSFIVTLMYPNVVLPMYAISRAISAVLSIYIIDCMVTGGCSMGASILAILAGVSILMEALGISIIAFS